jgi:hypothetical protein
VVHAEGTGDPEVRQAAPRQLVDADVIIIPPSTLGHDANSIKGE